MNSRRAGIPRIFISYQREPSAGWAVLFERELKERHNISAFVDTQRVDTAVPLPVKIQQGIQCCDIFVCFLAGTTLNSAWAKEEIRLAWENRKLMVPVFQQDFERPNFGETHVPHIDALMSYEGVHLLDQLNIYVDEAIENIAKIVHASIDNATTDSGV